MCNRVSYRSYDEYAGFIQDMPTFRTLNEIEKVLDELNKIVKTKGFTTLADFYKLTDGVVIDGDELFGWRNLFEVRIRGTRYGYIINLPRASKIHIDPNEKIKTSIDILDNAGDDLKEAANDVREMLNEMV